MFVSLSITVFPGCCRERRGIPRLRYQPHLRQLRSGLQVPPGIPQRGGAEAGTVVSVCVRSHSQKENAFLLLTGGQSAHARSLWSKRRSEAFLCMFTDD